MARSRRKTPKCGVTTAESEKKDKVLSHRATRSATKQALLKDEDAAIPPLRDRDVTNTYSMSKDGKQSFDPKKWPKGMRK
jgi:hypothetical protein